MITIWGRLSSSNAQAALWCLAELGLDYTRHDAGYIYGVTDTHDYLAMNPNGTIPTLIDGDLPPLWETGAILRYLAAEYGATPFWPADAKDRARVDQWAEWAKINIAGKFIAPVFQKLIRTAPSKRNYPAIKDAIKTVDHFLDIADQQLSRQAYLAGNDFTLADIQLGHVLYRYFDLDIKRPERLNLQRYYNTLITRPHYRELVMVSYEELRIKDD